MLAFFVIFLCFSLYAPAPNFSPVRYPSRGLGCAALDSAHAEYSAC